MGGDESQDVLQGLSRTRRFALSANPRFVKGKADFAKMLENKSWQQIYKSLQWWGKAYYKYCYIAEEATLIASLISEVWENLKSHKHEMTDDVLLSLSIYAEDYPVFNLDEI